MGGQLRDLRGGWDLSVSYTYDRYCFLSLSKNIPHLLLPEHVDDRASVEQGEQNLEVAAVAVAFLPSVGGLGSVCDAVFNC